MDMIGLLTLRNFWLFAGMLVCLELTATSADTKPPLQVKRVSKHISYPGVQGSPVVQKFYLWVDFSGKLRRAMRKNSVQLVLDSFYWQGRRGLGTYGKDGAEVKSMRLSDSVTESRYWSERLVVDSANKRWKLIVGVVEIPTRDPYLESLTLTGDNLENTVNEKNRKVDWQLGDPELLVFYTIRSLRQGEFHIVRQSVLQVDKIQRSSAVFFP